MFVAGFIGSPAMNFLACARAVRAGQRARPAERRDASPCRELHEDRERRRRACWACGRSISASVADGGAARPGVRRRVPGRPPGGHRGHRRTAGSRSRALEHGPRRVRARRVGLRFRRRPPGRCSTPPRATRARCAQRLAGRRRPMAEIRARAASPSASAASPALAGPVASRSPTASSWCCSGRPAPARPRRCGWSPAWSAPDAGRICDRRRAT